MNGFFSGTQKSQPHRDRVLVTKGARENRYRPGIDPLFRSAAVRHGPHLIGVLLSGMLDDGTAGLTAIKKCGGVTIVQDPKEAAYPEMPQSALNNLKVDYCLPIAEMGKVLERLIDRHPSKPRGFPKTSERRRSSRSYSEQAQATQVQIERIRAVLTAAQPEAKIADGR